VTARGITFRVVLCTVFSFVWIYIPFPAAAAPSPPVRDICIRGTVDKEKLGFSLLDMYGVTRAFESSLPPNPQPPFNTTTEFQKRYKKDLDGAREAQQHLISLLSGRQDAYKNPSGVKEPLAFLTDPQHQLVCRAENPAEPGSGRVAGTASTFEKLTNPLRIRGSTDGLFYARNMPQFKSVTPASIGFNSDDIKETRTDKLLAVIGYAFDFEPAPYVLFELIPYVGTNRNVLNQGGKSATTNQETVNFGVLNGIYFPAHFGDPQAGLVLGNWFTVRPDYLMDLRDDSRLFSLNAVYTPVINGVVNDYIRLIPDRDEFMWFRPIVDFRLTTAVYTERGTIDSDKREDYTRLGTQFGLGLSSDIPYLPLDLVVTHTYFHGFSGAYDALNYFKAMLTISFDPKRYFGVTLSYSEGRREDTAQRERLWGVSLSGRY
jgi:hypothetical protein